ncbi:MULTISPECIES: Type 1 glutamine amidotransferase-like domain-containing protein [Enterococcus]|uniref:Peptidase n=1 Tax=Enterococcus sulfureus ATCC 49903 TaxID=1140003 RepID=S0KZT8_9ENTE|nr:Type 1 glutamine amidotransferase-like domain-containing protein [Enterococcus sulfureus]EOT46580.1 hypothetical protein OMY_01729 [Enterococcus sulfureus ATCC 49903]EOT86108.1 hypothetical protein I573_00861 [Enterococcus sulfureus ATCC 49903]
MKTKFLCSSFLGSESLFTKEVSLSDKRIGFIPTASVVEEYDSYVLEAYQFLKERAKHVLTINLDQVEFCELKDLLSTVDILYISGGNTFYLLQAVYNSGFDRLMTDYLAKGNYLIGESAGAVIMTPDISYIHVMDDDRVVESKVTKGLGLVDRPIIPHVESEYLGQAAAEILNTYEHQPFYALTDQDALFF